MNRKTLALSTAGAALIGLAHTLAGAAVSPGRNAHAGPGPAATAFPAFGETRADEVSPLRRRLLRIDAQITGANTPFADIEKQAAELRTRYSRADERAQIYFELAHVYAQSGIRLHPERVARYARLALAFERDPVQRGTLYSYLGSALFIDPARLTFSEQRAQAAAAWLQGYKELLPLRLPAGGTGASGRRKAGRQRC